MRELPAKARVFIYLEWLVFVIFFAIFALVFKTGLIKSIHSLKTTIMILSLTVAIIASDLFPIIYSIDSSENKAELPLTFAINFALAVLFNPLIAMIVSFLTSFISQIITKKQLVKTLFNSTKISLTVGITSLFFYKYYSLTLPLANPKNLFAIGLGFIVYIFLDSVTLFALLALLNNKPFILFWYKNIKKVFFTLLALFFLGVVIIFFFQTQPLMNLFIIPTFIAVYLALKRDVQVTQETEQALYALAAVVDARIPDTMFHSDRVAKITRDLCEALNVDDDVTNVVVMSAKLHDIGKIAIPDKILQKQTKLTTDEYDTIKLHTIDGAQIAGSLTRFRKGATLIRHHHERYNGTGYPDEFKDIQIPLGARIIALVDSFDTMTTPRNYRKIPRTIDEALEEIEINKGTQFDPHISDVFIRMVREKKQKYQKIIDDARRKIEAWFLQQQ
jgi:HD-GYP domain-containing protein (c-di-GMP phosphodiesterase class II)